MELNREERDLVYMGLQEWINNTSRDGTEEEQELIKADRVKMRELARKITAHNKQKKS